MNLDLTYSSLELTRPHLLWLLLLLIPVVWFFHRSLSDFPKPQRWTSLLMRSAVLLLLVLALAGLSLLQPTFRQYFVMAVDQSSSIDQSAEEKVNQWVDQMKKIQGEDRVLFLPFASQPGVMGDKLTTPMSDLALDGASDETATAPTVGTEESSDSAIPVETEPGSEESEVAALPPVPKAANENDDFPMGTDLASAMETAAAAIPAGYVPHVVLLTDGRQTSGDAIRLAATLDTRVSVVPLPVRDEPEVQVAEVRTPAEVRQGEPFNVEVTINSNHEDQGYIDVYRGDVLVSQQEEPLKIKSGENRFRFRQSIDNESRTDYVVRVRGFKDTLLDNNAASAVVFASGKPSVLIVDSNVDEAREFRWALEEQEVLVQVRPAQGIPRSLSELQKFDCLILSNIPATVMSRQQMEIIRTYVEALGGGLVMIGGDQSFGLGGYYKTAIEEILPVRSNFEKEKEKPSLAMVLVIDKSGSMGGQKIELAKDAAKGAVELLGPKDQLGVIAFDGASYWASELHSASDRNYIVDRISTIEASGGTSIYPALSDAYEALSATSAKLKHVILLTDGHSSPGDFDGIANDMANSRITLSSVAVGAEADAELLERLAETGGGRYYMCDDPGSVPQIFAKETVEASKSAINELPFIPLQVRSTQVLSGLDMETAPFLLGYVKTQPKPTSEFILASDTGDPVLVWWRYGLGMTVAFTSDAKSRWAAEWLTWPDFGRFWVQIIRHAMRKNESKGVFVQVDRQDAEARVIVDSVDLNGRFINDAETKLNLISSGLDKQEIAMRQTGPGRYEGTFDASKAGAYQLELSQTKDGVPMFRQSRGMVVGYPEELRLGPADDVLMERVATLSGGTYNPTMEQLLAKPENPVQQALPLWPYLLTAAMILFVGDVALRRFDFSVWM